MSQPSTRPEPSNMPVAPHKPPMYLNIAQAGIQDVKAMAAVVSKATHKPML